MDLELPDFLTRNPYGEIRLTGHRIGLLHVVERYNEGYSPEAILCDYPALSLALIHKVIAFYLDHQLDVDGYVTATRAEIERQAAGTIAWSNDRRAAQASGINATRTNELTHDRPFVFDESLDDRLRLAVERHNARGVDPIDMVQVGYPLGDNRRPMAPPMVTGQVFGDGSLERGNRGCVSIGGRCNRQVHAARSVNSAMIHSQFTSGRHFGAGRQQRPRGLPGQFRT